MRSRFGSGQWVATLAALHLVHANLEALVEVRHVGARGFGGAVELLVLPATRSLGTPKIQLLGKLLAPL